MCFMPKIWMWSKPLGSWTRETTMAEAIEIIRRSERVGEPVLASPLSENRLEPDPARAV